MIIVLRPHRTEPEVAEVCRRIEAPELARHLELLMSAEYIMSEGNYDVILRERGFRTFEDSTRNTLDLSGLPVLKQLTHLPVVVDPRHGTGKWNLAAPMALAAVAAGADAILVAVHPEPEAALSDGPKALRPGRFGQMMVDLQKVAEPVGRTVQA